ncbi:desulfoferrodoxin ferrous iron-binding domain [Geoglobus ahangari]|uniref:Desulfoferrodoxin ferrous iron-binding domain n=1 Tax=Geoglobus ahangari TaxID=113653 RepID=A0A0F7IGH8_9EURY|nr:class II SORL domain-containing protein [Geoglobus ahangari]AKG91032.1 desulfoferrodoxin ferrous iron-binding domain [Geoglobus ahangari]
MSCENDLFCGVNRPKSLNPDEMSDLEKKHTPVISAPERVKAGEVFEVKVETGVFMAHPNEYGHYFAWIELYLDDTPVGRVSLQPVVSSPSVVFRVSATHSHEGKRKLRALAFCNLHGVWEGEKEIEVE